MARSPDGDAAADPTTAEPALVGAEDAPLRRVETVAHLMDDAFRVPGTDYRVGLDPILGILPVAGDSISALFSLYVVFEAAVAGVPRATLGRMLALVAVDAVAGSVPVIGPLFDAAWKANKWNAAALERHLEDAPADGEMRAPPGPAV